MAPPGKVWRVHTVTEFTAIIQRAREEGLSYGQFVSMRDQTKEKLKKEDAVFRRCAICAVSIDHLPNPSKRRYCEKCREEAVIARVSEYNTRNREQLTLKQREKRRLEREGEKP